MERLIPMNVKQIRRQGMKNAELQRKREKEFDNQVQSLSKHNVGNLYDVRAIAKSRQFKEQQSHYSTEQVLSELEDL